MGTEELLNVLHVCFITFLIITIAAFVLAIVLFFVLDIRNVFNAMTGRAVRKTVQEMEEANNATGRLRKVNKMAMGEVTPARTATDELLENTVTESLEADRAKENIYNNESDQKTTLLNDGGNDTTLLNAGETSVLGIASQPAKAEVKQEESVSIGKFVIIRNEMLIHTEEII